MLRDIQGLEVTTHSLVAIAAINAFINQALQYGREAELAIFEALSADPSCAIANAYAAAHYLSQESAIARQQAIPYLQAAQTYSQSATEREQLYIQAIAAWAKGAIDTAIAVHEAIAEDYPQDLISVQQGQYHYFYRGNKVGLLKIAEKVLPVHPNQPDLLSMLAFGLEQCHQLPEAEAIAREATRLKRNNPWAHHAVAHVMETQGRAADGIEWMEKFSDTWEHCNSMLYTHNWWHVALFYGQLSETTKVLSLYDQHIWGKARRDSPKDQVGAISLLLRLEFQSVPVEERWDNLVPHLLTRLHEHSLPFQDLHYIYALAKANQADLVHEMFTSMTAYAQTLDSTARRIWTVITLPAAQGMIAHARNDWEGAIAYLKPVLSKLWVVGGSHAQQQLFHQLYKDAVLRSEAESKIAALSWSPSLRSKTA
ncbi:tetratricopeptide repeat protein [Trichocoleus sp. FACHB-262]|uniref:tetratricopeptide repeat protein n=1 Tax=Trichocoleus sp. FACHB-262 TaxID=2692869 RepID=UPI001686B9F4|nr:tetratricopeptide repeat protein [Trichocoleus sp. FACHB-262]MBD2120482.1 tetratricopeptide repeat protein [Trichocoleus sp. FACHB-262]